MASQEALIAALLKNAEETATLADAIEELQREMSRGGGGGAGAGDKAGRKGGAPGEQAREARDKEKRRKERFRQLGQAARLGSATAFAAATPGLSAVAEGGSFSSGVKTGIAEQLLKLPGTGGAAFDKIAGATGAADAVKANLLPLAAAGLDPALVGQLARTQYPIEQKRIENKRAAERQIDNIKRAYTEREVDKKAQEVGGFLKDGERAFREAFRGLGGR